MILFLAVALIPMASTAKVVSPADAEAFARRTLKARTVKMVYEGRQLATKASGVAAPCFYVFNNPDGGWAIISAEDAAIPVLAWSEEGRFVVDDMPSNIESWMGRMSDEISAIRAEGIRQSEEVARMWDNLVLTEVNAEQRLLTTAPWAQGTADRDDSYNKFCPLYQGRHTIAGCTAVATAIVLRYHQWPLAGKGYLPAYDTQYKGVTVSNAPLNIDGYQYDWAQMALEQDIDHVNDFVAHLIHHCGMIIQVSYGTEDTSGNVESAIQGFVDHMSYSPKAWMAYRTIYGNNRWFELISSEIKDGRPVLYAGQSTMGGHAFVLDGCSADGRVHVNWGWGGQDNGWFALTFLAPGTSGNFSAMDSAVIGFEPDRDGSNVAAVPAPTLRGNGLELYAGTVARDTPFTMTAQSIVNFSYTVFNTNVACFLFDKNGNSIEKISENLPVNIQKGYQTTGFEASATLECRITSDLHFGDHIRLCYYDTPNDVWRPIGTDDYDSQNASPALYPVVAYGVFDRTFITLPSNLTTSSLIYPELILGPKAAASVKWTVDGSTANGDAFSLSAGLHVVRADIVYSDGTEESVTRRINVSR